MPKHGKRGLAGILCAGLLAGLLCGCTSGRELERAKEQAEASTAAAFVADARVHYGEIDADIRLSREAGGCEMVVINPEPLRDLTFLLGDRTASVRYKGLSLELDPDSLPLRSVAGLLSGVLDPALSAAGMALTLEEGAILLTGQQEAGAFTLRLDPENGNYLSLAIPEEDFSAEFTDFRFVAE